jgi:hypothetical protein
MLRSICYQVKREPNLSEKIKFTTFILQQFEGGRCRQQHGSQRNAKSDAGKFSHETSENFLYIIYAEDAKGKCAKITDNE